MANEVSLADAWMSTVKSLAKGDFMPLKDAAEIPVHIRLSSQGWYERILKPEANPYKTSNRAEHSFRPSQAGSPDLLRHEYTFREHRIVIVESRNFITLAVHDLLKSTSPDENVRRVQDFADALLQVKGEGYDLQFGSPTGNSDRFRLSTNPSANIVFLRTWHDRVDCYVENTSVTFMCYKRVEQLVGFQDDQEWFDKNFRARFALSKPIR